MSNLGSFDTYRTKVDEITRHGGSVSIDFRDPRDATGRCDFLLTNPPFSANAVNKERLKDMANSASTARSSEQELRRRRLI
jgi:hypothetical protein